jgi:acetamidase/formamidase
MSGARAALSNMIELLGRRFGYSAIAAYLLCSVCADLRINSIVDAPNWIVSFHFPRIVLKMKTTLPPSAGPPASSSAAGCAGRTAMPI